MFVGNSTLIDGEIFQLWVDGKTVDEAAECLQQRGVLQVITTGGSE